MIAKKGKDSSFLYHIIDNEAELSLIVGGSKKKKKNFWVRLYQGFIS